MFGKKKKGFSGIINVFIGLMVAILILVSIVIPTITDAIANSNITGTTATLLNLVPLLLVVAVVLLIVGIYRTK